MNKLTIITDYMFVEAVDGKDDNELSKYDFHIPNWHDSKTGKSLTRGELGCALSHYSIWKNIVEKVENENFDNNYQSLILEDDVVFKDKFASNFISYMSEINFPYDMIYLHRKPLDPNNEMKVTDHVIEAKYSYWTCAYLLTYRGAKKLINGNYLQNIIPVDEYISIMYGSKVNGFEKLYNIPEKLACYALTPTLLHLKENAFENSDTYKSNPYINTQKYSFSSNKEFKMIYIGPNTGDGYERFDEYCKIYGIPCIDLDNKQFPSIVLKNELSKWSSDLISLTLIMVVCVPQNKKCFILPMASPHEIIKKFNKLIDSKNPLDDGESINSLFSSDKIIVNYAQHHWNSFESTVRISSPIDNSIIGLIGWASSILELVNSTRNDQYNIFDIFLKKNQNVIIPDYESSIFQIVSKNKNSIELDKKKSRVRNILFDEYPCILYVDENNKKQEELSAICLNSIENYTGNNFIQYYGFSKNNTIEKSELKIYISVCILDNLDIINFLTEMNYPNELIIVRLNIIDNHDESFKQILHNKLIDLKKLNQCQEIYYKNIEEMCFLEVINFLNTDCNYYFFIGHDCIITNKNILNSLLKFNKKIIAPMIKRINSTWTNFWGDIRDNGYYKRSSDYLDLINYKIIGCWNIPYITGIYLIKREIFEQNPNLFTDHIELDQDMRFCHNLRQNDIFMHVSNMEKYGYIREENEIKKLLDKPNSIKLSDNLSIQSGEELTIYNFYDQREKWEFKYLHPEFLKNKNNLENLKYQELCHDVFNFPLFSKEFCREMIHCMEKYGKWSKGKNNHYDPRLGGNNYENFPTQDIHLNQIKFDKEWNEIVMDYISPIVKILYSNYKTKNVHLSFVVRYHYQEQFKLEPHHDSSTYTVNIALNQFGLDYEGGGCRFIRQNYNVTDQQIGTAIIHPGRLTHYHEGLQITSGKRYILVSFIN